MPQAHEASRNQIAESPVARVLPSPGELEGRVYGPFPLRVCVEKVAEFVAATRDDPERWLDFAPPGWAAVALFVVAPKLLLDPALASAPVIHGEQRFAWSRAIEMEEVLQVTGRVSRVRGRGGVHVVAFEIEASAAERPVLSGSSLFLVAGENPPAGENEERSEPEAEIAGPNDPIPLTSSGFPSLRRSASRADLIRYAAATRDWNPVHWDHRAAVAAGLGGVVAHGLLQTAWMLSASSSLRTGPAPFQEARFRFRTPLPAGAPARVSGVVNQQDVEVSLEAGDRQYVSGSVTLG